jgi:hypothetical protein
MNSNQNVIIDLKNGNKCEGILVNIDKQRMVINLNKAKRITFSNDGTSNEEFFPELEISKDDIKEVKIVQFEAKDKEEVQKKELNSNNNLNAIPQNLQDNAENAYNKNRSYNAGDSFFDGLTPMSNLDAKNESIRYNDKNCETFDLPKSAMNDNYSNFSGSRRGGFGHGQRGRGNRGGFNGGYNRGGGYFNNNNNYRNNNYNNNNPNHHHQGNFGNNNMRGGNPNFNRGGGQRYQGNRGGYNNNYNNNRQYDQRSNFSNNSFNDNDNNNNDRIINNNNRFFDRDNQNQNPRNNYNNNNNNYNQGNGQGREDFQFQKQNQFFGNKNSNQNLENENDNFSQFSGSLEPERNFNGFNSQRGGGFQRGSYSRGGRGQNRGGFNGNGRGRGGNNRNMQENRIPNPQFNAINENNEDQLDDGYVMSIYDKPSKYVEENTRSFYDN